VVALVDKPNRKKVENSMEFILIRHGEKQKIQQYNPEIRRNDPPLTIRGIKQTRSREIS
jgi:broad specificity phosphatase PhoE